MGCKWLCGLWSQMWVLQPWRDHITSYLPTFFTGQVWEFSILDAQENGSSLLTVTGGSLSEGWGGFILVLLFCHVKLRAFEAKTTIKTPLFLCHKHCLFLMPFYQPTWSPAERSRAGSPREGGRMVAGRVSSHSASIAVSSLSTWPGVTYQQCHHQCSGQAHLVLLSLPGWGGNWKCGPSAQNRLVFGWCWCCFGLIT